MPLELEVLGSKDLRQRLPDPRGSSWPGVWAPDRQGGPGDAGAALWALKAFLIHQLSIYSMSSFHPLSCSSQQRPGRRQPVTKRLWLPRAAARTGDRDEGRGGWAPTGQGPSAGAKAPGPRGPAGRRPAVPREPRSRGKRRLGTRAPSPLEASPCALAMTPRGGEDSRETQGSHSSGAWRGPD